MKTLVFGSLNQDIVYDVDHFGQPGETTKALRVSKYPGGKGLNQAIAAAKAGSPVWMAGTIGPDGTWLPDILENSSANASLVRIAPETGTGTAVIERDPSGANRILLDPGANSQCTPGQIKETLDRFEPGDLLICQNETNVTSQLLQQAASRHMKILFNPAPMTPDIQDLDLSAVTWLAVNESECARLLETEDQDPLMLCRLFAARYPETILLLTLGSRGSVCLDHGKLCFMPAFFVTARDTTGAGDTWLGYFADGCSRGLSLEEAMKRASAAAALSVQKEGAASSIPGKQEVDAFLETHPLEPKVWQLKN